MMKSIIARAIRRALRTFGYEIYRIPENAFSVQRSLIQTPEPVIFDIGAHIGQTAKTYREHFPRASIYSFEPFPESFRSLVKSREGDSRCFCHQAAVSEKEGKAFLNANSSSQTNSLLTTDKRGDAYWGEGLLDTQSRLEVPTTTVDAFRRRAGISHIDILKLDVQGAEFSVLSGSEETLSQQGVSLIYTELIMCPTYENQHKLNEYLTFLDTRGYELLDLFNPVRARKQLIQADLIFLSSSFSARL